MLAYLRAFMYFVTERKVEFNSPFLLPAIKIPFRYFLEIEQTIRKKRLYSEATDVYRETAIRRYIKIYYELLKKTINGLPIHIYADPEKFNELFKLTDRELVENYLDEKLRYEYFYPSGMRIHTQWIEDYGSYFAKLLGQMIEGRGLGDEVCFSYRKIIRI